MHMMQTVVTDMRGVCQSVMRLNSASLCGGQSVQSLPNYFGILLDNATHAVASSVTTSTLHCRGAGFDPGPRRILYVCETAAP